MTPDERLDQLWDILRDNNLSYQARVGEGLRVLRETKNDPPVECLVINPDDE